jgi:hypothetical protein
LRRRSPPREIASAAILVRTFCNKAKPNTRRSHPAGGRAGTMDRPDLHQRDTGTGLRSADDHIENCCTLASHSTRSPGEVPPLRPRSSAMKETFWH